MNFFSSPRTISLALGCFRFLKMFLGLVVLYLSIRFFGTSFERDSWVLALALYCVIVSCLYTPINEIFRTKFIFIKEQKGENYAVKTVNSLMNVFNCSYVGIALLLWVAMDPITRMLAPGFDQEQTTFLSVMILSLIPYFVFQQQGNVLIALLNTYDSYFYPEIVSLFASVINILSIIFLSEYLGIYSLVVATELNGLILVSVLSYMLHKKVSCFRLFSLETLSLAKPYVIFSLPMYFSALFVQYYIFVEKSTCTYFGEGSVSVFDYARQIASLPHMVFSSIVPIVMTPLLSKCFITGDEETFSDELRKFVRLMLYFTLFLVIVSKVNGIQLSYLLFSDENVVFIKILPFFALSIFCLVFSMICGQSLIARGSVISYVCPTILGHIVCILLCKFFSQTVELEYLAYFYLIGQAIISMILLALVKLKHKILLIKDLLIILLIGIISFFALNGFQKILDGTVFSSNDKIYAGMDFMLCLLFLFFIILSLLLIFGGDERKMILNFVSQLKNKRSK